MKVRSYLSPEGVDVLEADDLACCPEESPVAKLYFLAGKGKCTKCAKRLGWIA